MTRGGFALVRGLWLSWLQYRSFFFILAFGWMIPPLIYLLVWSTAAGDGAIAGLTRGEFVAYYLVLILVNQITYAQTNWTVGDLIRYGQMNPSCCVPSRRSMTRWLRSLRARWSISSSTCRSSPSSR